MEPFVYQATDGRWLVFHNDVKSGYFNTEAEAQNMASKLTLATQAQIHATTLAQVADDLIDLRSVYFSRGYQAAGSDPIVDDDVVSLGITAADLVSLAALVAQLDNFLSNAAVTSSTYDTTLNALRNDV